MLCAVLDRCADQNRRTRPTSTAERTWIRFIHIVSHGDKDGFLLRNADGSELAPEQLGAEFRRVKDANIRAVFLSSCKSARGRRMATSITQTAGIPYVIGYMNNLMIVAVAWPTSCSSIKPSSRSSARSHRDGCSPGQRCAVLGRRKAGADAQGCWHFQRREGAWSITMVGGGGMGSPQIP